MKSLWDSGISLQAGDPGVSPRAPTTLHGRRSTKSWATYISVFSTATAAVIYPFVMDPDHALFAAVMGGAIAVGAFPILKQAFKDLLTRRLGTAFCVSSALGLALSINEYLVALTLLAWALSMKQIEELCARRTKQLLISSEPLHARRKAGRFPVLEALERDTAKWLQAFFVYLSLAAALALLARTDVRSAVVVLVIGSSSALTVSMSVVRLAALLKASTHGFVTSDENVVERLASANVVILDEPAGVYRYQNSAKATKLLRAMGIKVILFTDALQPLANVLAERLGTDEVESELFSEDKPCKIAAMQQRHCNVVCLGDEKNADSSLAAADTAIVTSAEPTVSHTAAHAVLLSKDLNDFAQVVRNSRRIRRTGTLNCAVVVLVSSAILGLALQQKITPLWAVEIRFILDLGLAVFSAQFLLPTFKRKPVAAI